MQTSEDTKEVTDFIKEVEHPLKKEMEILREVILSADKEITEHIKWNAPSFCHNGDDRITMSGVYNLAKDNCITLVFHRGAKKKDTKGFEFKDDAGLFEWKAPDRALIKFSSKEEIESKKATLKKIVRNWIKATA